MIKRDVFDDGKWFGTICDKEGLVEKVSELAETQTPNVVYALKTADRELYSHRYWTVRGGIIGTVIGVTVASVGYISYALYDIYRDKKRRKDTKQKKK